MRLQITPAVSYLPVDLHKSLKAEAILDDGRVLDVTADPAVQWSSSNPEVATISNSYPDKGIVTGLAVGTVTITASGEANGQSFSETVEVNITNRIVTDLQITPKEYALPIGLQTNLTAKATLDNGDELNVTTDSTVKWSSDAEDIATVDQGTVTGHKVGTATITASGVANGKTFSDSAVVTITSAVVKELQINSHDPTLAAGLHKNLTAQARMSNGYVHDVTTNPALTWESSDDKIATISSSGVVTAKSAGIVEFTASGVVNNTRFSDKTRLTITNAFVQSLAILDVAGEPIVEPNNLPAGLHQQLLAQATMSNNTLENVTTEDDLHWNSLNPEVAIIDQNGRVTARKPGQATITARYIIEGLDPVAAPAVVVTVTDAFVVTLAILDEDKLPIVPPNELPAGLHQNLLAKATLSDKTVQYLTDEGDALSWQSDDLAVATIDEDGRVTARSPGEANITARYIIEGQPTVNAPAAVVTVTPAFVSALRIDPSDTAMAIYQTAQFNAIATMSDKVERRVTDEDNVNWQSENAFIATVDNISPDKGTVRANGVVDSVTITATYTDAISGEVKAEANLSVTATLLDYFISPPDAIVRTRAEAITHCDDLGARLPTAVELQNLFLDSTSATVINYANFHYEMCTVHGWPLPSKCGGAASVNYWSSDETRDYYRVVRMDNAYVGSLVKNNSVKANTACVRL